MTATADTLLQYDVTIDGQSIDRVTAPTSTSDSRVTTLVSFTGAGKTGRGEDVTYESDDHDLFPTLFDSVDLTGTYTLSSFSERLESLDLFPPDGPSRADFTHYRRWALESAALDLALKQADISLADALDRTYEPVRFVVSMRLGNPPSMERIEQWLAIDPTLEFKLDPTSEWTLSLIEDLVGIGAVQSLDLKGQYDGTIVDQSADPILYERVLTHFSGVVIEDPRLTDETEHLFDGHEDRVAWDYPITGIESIESLPWPPDWINIKPSRFGSVRSLFDTIDYCLERDISLYGGGQFELDVGRSHLHAIASLFYPDAPNDVAPRGYNRPETTDDVSGSPLTPPTSPTGLEW